jgi:UrcA family protein
MILPARIHQPTLDMSMNTKPSIVSTQPFICLAAILTCAALCGSVHATEHQVTIKVPVSTADLDPNQPAGARELYVRLQRAARIACTHGNRVSLEPPTSFGGCYEKALGDAVHSAHQPQLSIVYLAAHTARDAAKYGIEVPVWLAAE